MSDVKRPDGTGSKFYDKQRRKWRIRFTVDGVRKPFGSFATEADADEALANLQAEAPQVGITLRQWGEVHLDALRTEGYRSYKSIEWVWRSVICDAPFIDWPLDSIKREDIVRWVKRLQKTQKKKRSVLVNGERTTVVTNEPISRSYARNALSALRGAFASAIDNDPPLITHNPCGAAKRGVPDPVHDVKVPEDRSQNKKTVNKLDYLPQPDVERVLRCKACESKHGRSAYDVELLQACPHMPFEIRVALSGEVQQALRKGEICAQRWECVTRWVIDAGDVRPVEWKIARSWDGPTKNREERLQHIIPHFGRVLAAWWVLKGRPTAGLIFPAHHPRQLGPAALFVEAHPHLSNRAVEAAAKAAGLTISLRYIEVLRSQARARADRARRAERMYARGYDFGWSDTPYRDANNVLQVRAGWMTKLGIEHRIRFHDFRDTSATHLLSGSWGERWSINEVSHHIGHKDTKVTEERYAHLTAESKARAVAQIDPLAPRHDAMSTVTITDAAAHPRWLQGWLQPAEPTLSN